MPVPVARRKLVKSRSGGCLETVSLPLADRRCDRNLFSNAKCGEFASGLRNQDLALDSTIQSSEAADWSPGSNMVAMVSTLMQVTSDLLDSKCLWSSILSLWL